MTDFDEEINFFKLEHFSKLSFLLRFNFLLSQSHIRIKEYGSTNRFSSFIYLFFSFSFNLSFLFLKLSEI